MEAADEAAAAAVVKAEEADKVEEDAVADQAVAAEMAKEGVPVVESVPPPAEGAEAAEPAAEPAAEAAPPALAQKKSHHKKHKKHHRKH